MTTPGPDSVAMCSSPATIQRSEQVAVTNAQRSPDGAAVGQPSCCSGVYRSSADPLARSIRYSCAVYQAPSPGSGLVTARRAAEPVQAASHTFVPAPLTGRALPLGTSTTQA